MPGGHPPGTVPIQAGLRRPNDPTPSAYEYEERRNARIRAVREQHEGPMRRKRRVQPLLLLFWIAGTIALLGVLIVIGFNSIFAPRVMAWVEENPGAIEHGIVQDFVEWYRPELLADEPASDEVRRVTVTIAQGATESEIAETLVAEGLVSSEIAFHYAVINAEREGTIPAGTFDLSPTLRPSQIVAALQGEEFGPTTRVTLVEGHRLEEIVATFAASEMTMNMEEFASILYAPPAEILNEFAFLADLPAGRSLEGYIRPETFEFQISGENATPTYVVRRLLTSLEEALSEEILAGIRSQGSDARPGGHHRQHRRARGGHRRGASADRGGLHQPLPAPRAGDRRPAQRGPDPPVRPGHRRCPARGSSTPGRHRGRLPARRRVGHCRVVAAAPDRRCRRRARGVPAGLPDLLPGRAAPLADRRAAHRLHRRGRARAVAEGYLYFVAACPNGVRDGSHYFATTLPEHNANIARANEECAGV